MKSFVTRARRSRASRYGSRSIAVGVALLLPLVSACGGSSSTGPLFQLTQGQLIAAAESIFRHTVVTALELPKVPNDVSTGTPVNSPCTAGGSYSTTAFITGSGDPDAGTADLLYELGSTWDGCLEGAGSNAIEIRTSAAANGIISDFTFERFPNGEIEIEGFLIGRVEIETSVGILNCRVAYQILGEETGSGEEPDISFIVAGDICEQGFGFDLVVIAGD
jgi:hypothetical protein